MSAPVQRADVRGLRLAHQRRRGTRSLRIPALLATPTSHLLDLIGDLLGHARIEAGEEVVRCEAVRLADVIEDSLTLVRPLAEQKGLRLVVQRREASVELFTDDPFWQPLRSAVRSEASTGLGLSIARQLVRLLGGDVFLTRSTVEEGSTFLIPVPARYAGREVIAGR